MSHIIHLSTNKATESLREIKRQHLNSIGYDAVLKEQYMAQLGKTKHFRQGGLKKNIYQKIEHTINAQTTVSTSHHFSTAVGTSPS